MDFTYIPLRDAGIDIRLVSLLPDHFPHPLKVILWHTPLNDPETVTVSIHKQDSISKLRQSLPEDWVVAETLEGRPLFEHKTTERTSWSHPNPTGDQHIIRGPLEMPPEEFKPRYEALSYLWGSSDNPSNIHVAQSGSCHFPSGADYSELNWSLMPITRNLEAALRHLRLRDKPRILWIDAICINQKDHDEKAKQIIRMSALYRMATRVVVWLGPENTSEQSKLAISTLEFLGKQVEVDQSTVRFISPDATEPTWFRSSSPLPYAAETWLAIQTLLSRPYFERLWIMQEVMLANSKTLIVCGQDKIAWYHFIRAVICLVAKDYLPTGLRRQLEFVRALTWRFDQLSIPFIMNLGRQRQCFDLKDRIYGVLGITPLRFTQLIKPNYDIRDERVFMEAALACMKYDNRLSPLQDCELSSSNGIQLPSWVPNWSAPRCTRPLSAFVLSSGISRAFFQLIEPNILKVKGRRLEIIRTVSLPAPQDPYQILCHIQKIEPPDLVTASYVSGGSLMDAFLTVLTLGYLDERWAGYNQRTMADWKDYFFRKLHSINGVPHKNEAAISETYFVTSILKGRTIVRTEDNHIGLAPAGAMQGDIACSLLGCKSSILLRKASDGKHFRVVGECYIHGLDDSVGLLGPLPNGWRVQIKKDASGYAQYIYYDSNTNTKILQDPRLSPLPWPWTPFNAERQAGSPALWACFKNIETGEVIDYDPRFSPDALEKLKVDIEDFLLC